VAGWALVYFGVKGVVVCLAVLCTTVRSESRCALRLRYVDLVVSIEARFNELKTAITACIRNISKADLQKVFANKIKRVQACIDARGDITSNTFYKCTATFRTHCTSASATSDVVTLNLCLASEEYTDTQTLRDLASDGQLVCVGTETRLCRAAESGFGSRRKQFFGSHPVGADELKIFTLIYKGRLTTVKNTTL
jgi:hypothetical protein